MLILMVIDYFYQAEEGEEVPCFISPCDGMESISEREIGYRGRPALQCLSEVL